MLAAVVRQFGGPDMLQLMEVADPIPGPGQVSIRVESTSVNFIDILSRKGIPGYVRELPFIPGREAAGTVCAVGEGVTGLQPGQRVMALTASGSYAEKTVAEAARTFPVPESMDMAEAGGILMVGITAYNVLMKAARLAPGESILIHAAAGGVGSIAVQLAKRMSASIVIGTAGNESKTRRVAELGADAAIDYKETDFAERVLELTGGKGVNVILDSVAGEILERGMDCLADGGRYVVYSHAGGREGMVSTLKLTSKSCSVQGYSMRTETSEEIRRTAALLMDDVVSGRIRIPVDGCYSLAQAAEAQWRVESRQSAGKVFIRVR